MNTSDRKTKYQHGLSNLQIGTASSYSELWVPIYIFVDITMTCVAIYQYLAKNGTVSSDSMLCKLFHIANHNAHLKMFVVGTPIAIV